MISIKQSLQTFVCLGVVFAVGPCRADILSVTPGYSYSAGPVTNTLVNFTDWNPGGCGGTDPCTVGASIVKITGPFESGSGMFGTATTFTYGSNFDFDYPTTGFGDRLILRLIVPTPGLIMNFGITGGTFYQSPSPQGIPAAGVPGASGLSSCPADNPNPGNYCYSFSPDISVSSGATYAQIALPWADFSDEVDVYLAVQGLNPNGGTFTIATSQPYVAPEPSSLVLLGSGMAVLAGTGRRRLANLIRGKQLV